MTRTKILVVSHERSGTHFLINTLARNFGLQAQQIDLDLAHGFDPRDRPAALAGLARFRGRPVGQVFKAHHASALLLPVLDTMRDEFIVLYIHRDGRDALTSLWHWLNRLRPGWGPQTTTVGEFLRATPSGGLLQYQEGPVPNMLARWRQHVEGWLAAGNAVHRIAYEGLHGDFDATVARLATILETPVASARRPGLDDPSSLPWRGQVGNWRNAFTAEDAAYFEREAGATLRRMGYG